MKHIAKLLFASVLILSGCSSKENTDVIRVGVVAGPESQLMEKAAEVALRKYGLHVKIVDFSDFVTPNTALAEGNIDANAYQHLPFLEAQIKDRHYKMTPVGKTFLYPMGLYSKKIETLSQLPNGAQIAIPNDPSNEARALLLLEKAGLIELKPGAGTSATLQDIAKNPRNFKIIELDGAELPRALGDVSLAAINTTFVIPAGLSPKSALAVESTQSPYTNLIVVRTADQHSPKIQDLVKAYQSPEVVELAKKLFGDSAIPAWQ
jgi:D-methionine transport system substrate-binding protein